MTAKLLLLVATTLLAAGGGRATSVFVAPVPGDDDAARALTQAVEAAVLGRLRDVEVVTPKALEAKLDVDLAKECAKGGDGTSCVVEFAQAMGVQMVLRPDLATLGDTTVLSLALYDTGRAALLGQGQRRGTVHAPAQLLDQVPDLVAEVGAAGGLPVIAGQVRGQAVTARTGTPYVALGELVGGGALLLAGGVGHALTFLVAEPAYADAAYTRDEARAWEATRPFAIGLPVLAYVAGGALLVVGALSLPAGAP